MATVMDVLLAGKCLSWDLNYDVRLKVIDPKITPQNRIIVCRAMSREHREGMEKQIDRAHHKLARAYHRAHAAVKSDRFIKTVIPLFRDARFLGGTAFGVVLALAFVKMQRLR